MDRKILLILSITIISLSSALIVKGSDDAIKVFNNAVKEFKKAKEIKPSYKNARAHYLKAGQIIKNMISRYPKSLVTLELIEHKRKILGYNLKEFYKVESKLNFLVKAENNPFYLALKLLDAENPENLGGILTLVSHRSKELGLEIDFSPLIHKTERAIATYKDIDMFKAMSLNNISQVALENGKTDEAIKLANKIWNENTRFICKINIAKYLINTDKVIEGNKILSNLFNEIKEIETKEKRSTGGAKRLAEFYIEIGNFKKAKESSEYSFKNAQKIKSNATKAEHYASLAIIYRDLKDIDRANQLISESIQIADNLKSTKGSYTSPSSEIFNIIGQYYFKNKEVEKAINIGKKSLESLKDYPKSHSHYFAISNLIKYVDLIQAKEIVDKITHQRFKEHAIKLLALKQVEEGNIDEALLSIELLQNNRGKITTLIKLIEYVKDKKLKHDQNKLITKVHEVVLSIENKTSKIFLLFNMVSHHIKYREFKKSKSILIESIQVIKSLDDKSYKINHLTSFAILYSEMVGKTSSHDKKIFTEILHEFFPINKFWK